MHVRTWFRAARPVPAAYRANFIHLYLDIAWFGILSASTMAFTSVYAARQGASAFQLGLLSAGPAVVSLLFTLPTGRWLQQRPLDSAVFWTAALNRAFYLLWLPLPLLLAPGDQVWALIALTLLMTIPGTSLSIGFNALFAEAVPPEWRGHVVGVRNALLAVVFIAVSLLCGQILDTLPHPAGYQVVFALGLLGAVMSTVHLWFVTARPDGRPRQRVGRGLGDLAWPGTFRHAVEGLRPGTALRFLTRRRQPRLARPQALTGPFGRLVLVVFAFHLALNLAIPLFPIRWVNQLQLTDKQIAWGTAAFYLSVFIGSTQLERLVRKMGNQRVTALGAAFMSAYPAFMALARGLDLFLVGSVLGGFGWSLVAGALTNHVLEKAPADHRPSYLAWYNLSLNAALLLGALAGPLVAGVTGVPLALVLFALLRLLGALAIWRLD